MKLDRLHLLLAAWFAALVVPPALVMAGVFGDIDVDTAIPGSLMLVWLAGFVVQLGIFMVAVRAAGEPRIVWWLVASLLPWIFDWGSPVYAWIGFVCMAIAGGTALWIAHVAEELALLHEHGLRLRAEVLEVVKGLTNVVVNRLYVRRTVRVRVVRDNGEGYEATLRALFEIGKVPAKGDTIDVLVDRENPTRMIPA